MAGRTGAGPVDAVIVHSEAIMRALFAVLALLGVAGIVVGVLTIVRGMNGPAGMPFRFENYGGPGPIIAGLIVLAASLYLLSIWKHRE
jgi:formate hydrogenlyase subunit 3/multisubunit Na+/H+ antiporter MnhD subunit